MAYVFRFPTEITEILYSMRDWKYERVKWRRGTPSKIALSPYKIMNHTIEHVPKQLFPSTYWITVCSRLAAIGLMGYTIISLTKSLRMIGLAVIVEAITTLQR